MEKKLLHELPRMSPLRVEVKDEGWKDAVFHHVDGMYSYCTLGSEVPENYEDHRVFHLKLWTPMVLVDDRWQIDREAEDA